MKKLLYIFSFLLSPFCFADNPVIGNVDFFSAISTSSGHVGAGYVELGIEGMILDAPCVWLWIKQEDEAIMSILLSAQARQKKVTVYYRTDLSSPWATGSCGVTTVQLKD